MVKLISFNSPQWTSADQSTFKGVVQWNIMSEPALSGFLVADPEPHVQGLYQRMMEGEFGAIAAYVPPTQEELDASASFEVRAQRDTLLATEVDPLVTNSLRWADLTSEQQTAWATYRTALLDITEQAGFPHEVTWPTKPEGAN